MMPYDQKPQPSGWAAHQLAQLRYFRSLSLRQKLESVEGMADVVRRFQQMREEGKFKESLNDLEKSRHSREGGNPEGA